MLILKKVNHILKDAGMEACWWSDVQQTGIY